MVWFREDVTVSAAQARQQAVLAIGPVDDADRNWVNGVAVGGNGNPGEPRTYLVPVGTLVAGRNNITVTIGRAHVCTLVTNAHIVCRLLLEKNTMNDVTHSHQ